MSVVLHHGKLEDVLPTLAADSHDAIVTDTPYEINFMAKGWDKSGVSFRVETWLEQFRVLKPGGYLLAFGGNRTHHRMVCAIEDAGFEIRDEIDWLFGSGFPKSLNLEGEWDGWGTALKPAKEPICVARKPLIGTVAENLAAHRTGALNIDGCRIPAGQIDDYGRSPLTSDGVRSTQRADGYGLDGSSYAASQLGRWPANVIHDGSPEVVALFPGEAGAQARVNGDEPSESTNGILHSRARVAGAFHNDSGSAARFFYCAKASTADRDHGCEMLAALQRDLTRKEGNPGGDNPRNRGLQLRKNFHPTVKPTALMRYLVRLVTPPGGTVLDPFMGSGSTGRGAVLEGFNFVGIEMTPEYMPIARARIDAAEREKAAEIEEAKNAVVQHELAL